MKNFINNFSKFVARNRAAAFLFVVTLLSAPMAHATDPDVAGVVTDAGALLTSIYPIVLGAVSFGILISLVKMVRRK